ncbi:polysaccharide biosynthesis/export family protein [Prosthecomicrobium pneumaticum]|uniref:Polysaccharide export outer membrane protein n=1 Tax=Prosthecomicrobium pneumaticum TaxID=81895 RepID=A0A7W9FJV7_9HYPH|nr:polysaccharide biosynthesis/export family protein [Prosthecomicrobium pneumaticum]MBB5751900.1 polysaccharide export outer membrane protein [Prosthecomicrobium pneumaticum]
MRFCVLLLLAVVGLAGCVPVDRDADSPSAAMTTSGAAPAQAPTAARPAGAAAAAGVPMAAASGLLAAAPQTDYVIQPYDVIDINVFQVADLSRSVDVSSSGTIVLPLIGQLQAAGKTARQLEQEITTKLQADYLQSPQVTVSVKEALTQTVIVDGAVKSPGVYPVKGKMTLLQALVTAGGIDLATADPSGIVVLRRANGQAQVAKFDYDAISSGRAQDPVLLAGDLVKVDRSGLRAAFSGLRAALPVFGFFAPLI